MRKHIHILAIIIITIVMSGCMGKKDENVAAVATEIAELKEISVETAQKTFYNLSLGNDNSIAAKMTTSSLESSGTFKYIDMVDGEAYVGNVVHKDDMYYDIMMTPNGKISVTKYDSLNITEGYVELNDNINRRGKYYSLQNDMQTKDLFVQTSNITPSSYVDVLKQYKGKTDDEEYADCDNPQDILREYYDLEKGLSIGFKYTTKDETGRKVYAIERISDVYCLTIYDPEKDWFEVRTYQALICTQQGNLLQYYLANGAILEEDRWFLICEQVQDGTKEEPVSEVVTKEVVIPSQNKEFFSYEEGFCYDDGRIRIEGYDMEVNGWPSAAFTVKIENGVAEKEYQFNPVCPGYLGDYEAIQVICVDLTQDGIEEYVIRYLMNKGTGSAAYEMKIIDGDTLDIIPVFDKAKGNNLNPLEGWTGEDVFTDEQLEKVNRIIGEMKQKDDQLSWWKGIDNDFGLLYFVATPVLKDNQPCIRVGFNVPVENEPVPLGGFSVFLTYDGGTGKFVVNDEILYYPRDER